VTFRPICGPLLRYVQRFASAAVRPTVSIRFEQSRKRAAVVLEAIVRRHSFGMSRRLQ
jgi:hypothetical protein